MRIINDELGVLLLEPRIFKDDRGFFFEAYNEGTFKELGITDTFVQDNHSSSKKGTVRGIHYQLPPKAQSKLVRVIKGKVLDFAIDLRKSSPTFLKFVGYELSEDNQHLMYIPSGFGHVFLVLSESAEFHYKCDDFYSPEHERSIIWNDPDLQLPWPSHAEEIALLSPKDLEAVLLKDADLFL